MTSFYFVHPTDSIFVRGNMEFGGSGEHGASAMPPQPSLFAGAFRSAILGRDKQVLAAFTRHGATGRAEWDAVLGKLDPRTGKTLAAGSFRITWASLAGVPTSTGGKQATIAGAAEPIMPAPADIVLLESGFTAVVPCDPDPILADGRRLPRVATLRAAKQEKPRSGTYLRWSGWMKYLDGVTPDRDTDGVKDEEVHVRDPRLGIALGADSRTVQPGRIYTMEGHAFGARVPRPPFVETGFLVGIEGTGELLPQSGLLRLGGDGRSAEYRRVAALRLDLPRRIAIEKRFRLILTTPGVFTDGWLPECVRRESDGCVLSANGCTARLVCAAVPRCEIISGWDLFKWRPKDARRVAPAGSVYWFEDLRGEPGKLAEWIAGGLWGQNCDSQRRAEGYNLATLGAWQ